MKEQFDDQQRLEYCDAMDKFLGELRGALVGKNFGEVKIKGIAEDKIGQTAKFRQFHHIYWGWNVDLDVNGKTGLSIRFEFQNEQFENLVCGISCKSSLYGKDEYRDNREIQNRLNSQEILSLLPNRKWLSDNVENTEKQLSLYLILKKWERKMLLNALNSEEGQEIIIEAVKLLVEVVLRAYLSGKQQ
jgi:hypothetical protein